MGLRIKSLIFCAFTEKSDFQREGNSQKTNIKGGGLPKKGGAWTVCRFKGGGGLGKKEGGGGGF